jgi:predicted dinucleotide-binding enzyme
MKKKIGIIGSGQVAQALGRGFLAHGYDVKLGSREPAKLEDWKISSGPAAQTGNFTEAARFGDIIVLAVAGKAAEAVITELGNDLLKGKTVIDATNPIADAPPVNGVLQYFTGPNESLMERLQALAPDAHFVKAFSCVGNMFMVNPELPGGKPTMFICGNSASAKKEVEAILLEFGWEFADMGAYEAARAIEPLAMLWCIPGFLHNQWAHAFKLLQVEADVKVNNY